MSSYQFSTIATADLLDALCAALDAIRASTAIYNKPWMDALDRAWDHLLTTETIEYDLIAFVIRVPSATREGRAYVSNGDCQCEAFTRGTGICWHRAAARLVRRALEVREHGERRAVWGEAYDTAIEIGHDWGYAQDEADNARDSLPELLAYAAEWDADAARQKAAGLAARIGAAQAAAMAAA